MEKVDIDVGHILAAFHSLQKRVKHVIVEGTGGWMVPIHHNYFVSDLAVAMKVPVVAVAYNRIGCLNHAVDGAKYSRTRIALYWACIE